MIISKHVKGKQQCEIERLLTAITRPEITLAKFIFPKVEPQKIDSIKFILN